MSWQHWFCKQILLIFDFYNYCLFVFQPLYIPPYVNTCGYTSRLRSPRLWDPSNLDHKKLSPPPYTPPPMLSPVRSGSGLFWHIISGSGSLTPKSAPITPSFGLTRKGKFIYYNLLILLLFRQSLLNFCKEKRNLI